jgi:hypothetical protein
VAVYVVDQFVVGGPTEWVVGPRVKVGQGLEHVVTGQAYLDRLGHGRMIAGPRGTVTNLTRSAPRPWSAGLGRHVVPDGASCRSRSNVARPLLRAPFLTRKSGLEAKVGAVPL